MKTYGLGPAERSGFKAAARHMYGKMTGRDPNFGFWGEELRVMITADTPAVDFYHSLRHRSGPRADSPLRRRLSKSEKRDPRDDYFRKRRKNGEYRPRRRRMEEDLLRQERGRERQDARLSRISEGEETDPFLSPTEATNDFCSSRSGLTDIESSTSEESSDGASEDPDQRSRRAVVDV